MSGRSVVCVLLMLGIVAAWYLVGIRNSVSFWYSDDDYAYLSLSHALSFNQRLRTDAHINDVALTDHPGIPFYLTSWLAFKIAVPAAQQQFVQVLGEGSDAPERFWLVSRAFAMLLALCGVALIFRAAAGKLAASAATVLFFGVSDQPWVAMSRLGNESFTLLYALLFYLAARKAFSDRRRSLGSWFVFGMVGGLGYLIKLPYIAFALGSGAGLIAMLAVKKGCRLSEALRLGSAYVIGFVLSFGSIALAILGRARLWALLRFHFNVATHSGYFGGGDANVFSPAQVEVAVGEVASMHGLIAVFLCVVAAALYVLVRRWPEREWRGSVFPFGVALLVALLLAVLSVLKHYQPYYLVVPISIIVLLLLYVAENAVPPLASRVFVVLVGALAVFALPFNLLQFDLVQRQHAATEARLKDDETEIRERPLGPDEHRFWYYRVPGRGFGVGFVVDYAGSPVISDWYEHSDLRDRYAQLEPGKPWRYAIVRKSPQSTREDIVKQWGFAPEDRVALLRETALIEREPKDKP